MAIVALWCTLGPIPDGGRRDILGVHSLESIVGI